jgi:hypothetical protein
LNNELVEKEKRVPIEEREFLTNQQTERRTIITSSLDQEKSRKK